MRCVFCNGLLDERNRRVHERNVSNDDRRYGFVPVSDRPNERRIVLVLMDVVAFH